VWVPRLWTDTIEAHRRDVRQAIMDTTWQLVVDHGVLAVTMSRIAEQAGIGRATLYKYFPDVESILFARHNDHVAHHLTQLAALRDAAGGAAEAVEAVLTGYARICQHRGQGSDDLVTLLHRGEDAARAQQQLTDLLQGVLVAAAGDGVVRTDVAPAELTGYCLHALAAAGALTSEDSVKRLVVVVLQGLAPPGPTTA
jgi:AcrR family transcriptional regulator